MSGEDKKIILNQPLELLIGFVATIISLSLLILIGWLLNTSSFSQILNDPKRVTIVSIPITFALFFITIAFNIFRKSTTIVENKEIMPEIYWYTLAIFLLLLALLVAIFGHWFGTILPIIISFICLLKNQRFREMFCNII